MSRSWTPQAALWSGIPQKTLARQGRDAVMNKLADALEHVASERRTEIKGVGLSLASPVEPGTGVMYNPPKSWEPEWASLHSNTDTAGNALSLPRLCGERCHTWRAWRACIRSWQGMRQYGLYDCQHGHRRWHHHRRKPLHGHKTALVLR